MSRFTEPTSVTAQSSPAGVERLRGEAGQRHDRGGAEDQLRALDRRGNRVVRRVDRAELDGAVEQLAVGIEPRDLGVEPGASGEPDRSSDQADAEDGDLHGLGQAASRRLRTAEASRSRVSTVVSQSMHASVIDWP